MFKRVTAMIAFTRQDEAEDFYHDCQLALAKGVTINPGQPNQETSSILLQDCKHDETPPGPCILLSADESP